MALRTIKDKTMLKTTAQEAKCITVLFWTHSNAMHQLVHGIDGEPIDALKSSWLDIIRVPSAQASILLLRTTGFEHETFPDLSIFRQVAQDLQSPELIEYLHRYPKYSISAIYLHLDGQSSSLAVKRNFQALQQLSKSLGYRDLSLCVLSQDGSKHAIKDPPTYLNGLGLGQGQEGLICPYALTINQLLQLLPSLSQPNHVYAAPDQRLKWEDSTAIFHQAEARCFRELSAERIDLDKALSQARRETRLAHNSTEATNRQLQEATERYHSLLQQIPTLRDNTELRDIRKRFENLNDRIDKLATDVVQGISQEIFDRYQNCQACHDSQQLFKYVGKDETPLLILCSQAGVSMPTEIFLGLFAKATACQHLCSSIFSSFYPLSPASTDVHTRSSHFETLKQIYEELRLRDSQIFSAKWRVDTFYSIDKLDNTSQDDHVNAISMEILSEINLVLSYLFGGEFELGAGLTRQTIELVHRAWEINHKLKLEVIHAGDALVDYFPFNTPFDSLVMRLEDSSSKEGPPSRIVSTAGLGVRIAKAVGEGKQPEWSVLLKAVVMDEQVYD